jgi:hypothetical protein
MTPGGQAAQAHAAATEAGLDRVAAAQGSRRWQVIELFDAWVAAAADAREAYDAWRAIPGRGGFTVYRAAQDRADAAQDRLANAFGSTSSERGAAWL